MNARDDVCGATPLMIAADAEQANALNAILAYPDVLVNAVDEDGCTALHYAATIGNAEITKSFLTLVRMLEYKTPREWTFVVPLLMQGQMTS